MIFLLNVFFRLLHVLMVLLPSQRVVTLWLRQMAEDALLIEHVAVDIRLAGELFRLKSRYTGGGISAAEQTAERLLRNAAYRLGCAIFHGLSSCWPAWVIHELECRGSCTEEGFWYETSVCTHAVNPSAKARGSRAAKTLPKVSCEGIPLLRSIIWLKNSSLA